MRKLHRSSGLLLLALVGACAREFPINVTVVVPDGGDPFRAGGTLEVRTGFEGDNTSARTTVPGANGSFSVEARPTNPNQSSRFIVEVLRDGTRVGIGATPPVRWGSLGPQQISVFVQSTDTLVEASTLRFARAEHRLLSLSGLGLVVVTTPSGSMGEIPADGFDLLSHSSIPFMQAVPAVFDGDTDVVAVRGGYLLLRGSDAAFYTGDAQMLQRDLDVLGVPSERRALRAATVLDDLQQGGAWIAGGTSNTGTRSTRVDRVQNDRTFLTSTIPPLARARSRAISVPLRVGSAPLWLLAGGQEPPGGFLERYSPAEGGTVLSLGDSALDARRDAALVCIASDTDGCSRVLVLGGREADNQLSREDLLLDGACLRQGNNSTCVRSRGTWMTQRRWGARAALAEGGRVLVVGGQNSTGPTFEAETINVEDPNSPTVGRVVATLPVADPAVLTLPTGAVAIAGGRQNNAPNTGLWFYRR